MKSRDGGSEQATNAPEDMCQFLTDIITGTISACFASAVIVAVTAQIKASRLKKEFDDLSRLLMQAYRIRSSAQEAQSETDTENMVKIKMQIEEVIAEVNAAKEGVFGISHEFKKKLKSLEREVSDLLGSKDGADFVKVLYNVTVVEKEFREKILAAGKKAADMRDDLDLSKLVIP